MKLLLSLCLLSTTYVFGQYNIYTNDYSTPATSSPVKIPYETKVNGIPCDPDKFYSVDNAGVVREHTLSGGTVSPGTSIISGCGYSVAFCDNMNGAFSPTMYSESNPGQNYTVYDGANWVNVSNDVGYNYGGYGTDLYSCFTLPGSPFSRTIDRFDGTNATTIYSSSISLIGVADLACDIHGNVWFLSTTDSSTFVSDSLRVLSPTGTQIASFPLSYSMYNAYGAMVFGDTYYVALGSSNPTSPNSLLPIDIVSGNAVIGTPIPMPTSISYYDLATCNEGDPLQLSAGLDQLQFTTQKELVKIVDYMGRETKAIPNTPRIYIYSDGSTERVFKVE